MTPRPIAVSVMAYYQTIIIVTIMVIIRSKTNLCLVVQVDLHRMMRRILEPFTG